MDGNQEKVELQQSPERIAPLERYLQGSTTDVAPDLIKVPIALSTGVENKGFTGHELDFLLKPEAFQDQPVTPEAHQEIRNARVIDNKIECPHIAVKDGKPVKTILSLGNISSEGRARSSWIADFVDAEGNPIETASVQLDQNLEGWFEMAELKNYPYKGELKLKFVKS